ncbi:MAG TPA: CoA transferase [Acetobacteraceae bacterium]|jgi:crotonobetainyl-CoA:carnitine CoA-transferase CaiB-like acyl-CoA transferase|nr:CoA transferase [Acetobacteraceae bacterium]
MSLLTGFRVVQIGPGLAAAVCGRLLADVGAEIACVDPDRSTPLAEYLNLDKSDCSAAPQDALTVADLIVCEGSPAELRARQQDAAGIRRLNAMAALVFISPFGQTGPQAEDPATDLTLFFASGIARLLTGQVDDLAEAPIRPVGEQSAFIGGIAAACAGMHAAQAGGGGAVIDVSIQEALATMAMSELTGAGLAGKSRSRKRLTDGNGATVCILPARDGYAAISPREDRQWASWLAAMGSPDWGSDPRFRSKPDRIANWDALHTLMSDWSRRHDKQWIADTAQKAHVPSFPLREPAEQLGSPQLEHRGFWRPTTVGRRTVTAPRSPFGLTIAPGDRASLGASGALPLSGVRVLDFSWVIAGPTTTRYLAAMGAEVIKVEAPGRGDPGRATELHTVLGQAKRGIVLDLKKREAVDVARALAARSDILVENFATGVMDRLGLGAESLRAINPNLIYVSASGLGRTGPESHAVAYGTLLQCYAGFAGLNRHPDIAPRVGFAWLDPMCGLMLAFIAAATLWRRRRDGAVARIDFSMIEAMLWTMAEPLLATQIGDAPKPRGNFSPCYVPHGAYRGAGDDEWISVAVRSDEEWRCLCAMVPALMQMAGLGFGERMNQRATIDAALGAWFQSQPADTAAAMLLRAGIPAASLVNSVDLAASGHLGERGFWEPHGDGALPGLPWRSSFGRRSGAAPDLGADTDAILHDVLELSHNEIDALRRSGALG